MQENPCFEEYMEGQETKTMQRLLFLKEFRRLLMMYFALGYNQLHFANESKTHPALLSRALNGETVPNRPHLLRWCHVLYRNNIIKTVAEGDNLFHLLEYASPSEARKALEQTTEQHAIIKPTQTDELPPAPPLPEWAKRM